MNVPEHPEIVQIYHPELPVHQFPTPFQPTGAALLPAGTEVQVILMVEGFAAPRWQSQPQYTKTDYEWIIPIQRLFRYTNAMSLVERGATHIVAPLRKSETIGIMLFHFEDCHPYFLG